MATLIFIEDSPLLSKEAQCKLPSSIKIIKATEAEALSMINKEDIALVVVDGNNPVPIAKHIRAADKDIPIVIYSTIHTRRIYKQLKNLSGIHAVRKGNCVNILEEIELHTYARHPEAVTQIQEMTQLADDFNSAADFVKMALTKS